MDLAVRSGDVVTAELSDWDRALVTELLGRAALPGPVRDARDMGFGLGAVGLAYPLIMWLTIGDAAGLTAATQYLFGVPLGLIALRFTRHSSRVRTAALAAALAQGAMGVLSGTGPVPFPLWVVASLYSLVTSCAILYQLNRSEAMAWFDQPRLAH